MSETFLTTITSIGGGFFAGIMLGYFLKKVIKILMFVAGGIVALLLYLQEQQVISVDVEKIEASSTFIFNSVASSFDKMTQIGDMSSLGIPLTASMAAGFTVALVRG
jgi:uncharacterized membrane protein (Fun14 family)